MLSEGHAVRLDRWLWAARFFKTRSAASQAINGGKVHVNGQRVSPARLVRCGDWLEITRGTMHMTVVIKALSSQRRSASEAQLLYIETNESREKREFLAAQHRSLIAMTPLPKRRPDKRERRKIRRLAGKE